MEKKVKTIFGPVASRRFGRSLGIDLVPKKTCSLDCVYCECGKTTALVTQRMEYVPTDDVLEELGAFLAASPDLDALTFSGGGEPTLHSGIGRVIRFLKSTFPAYKLVLLTNSVHLTDVKVRQEVQPVDVIVPSLDAATQAIFEKINRPGAGITVEAIIAALAEFQKTYSGEMVLEIFIVPGSNDTEASLCALEAAIARIRPTRVQLNTIDRPGTEVIVPAARKTLIRVAERLGAELIPERPGFAVTGTLDDSRAAIVNLIERRPCTMAELAGLTGLSLNRITELIDALVREGRVTAETQARGVFYRAL